MALRRNCDNCKYRSGFPCASRCIECISTLTRNLWEPEEKERKDCDTCIHSDARSCDEPCRSCCSCVENIFPNWEQKEKEDKKMDNRKTKAQLIEELEQKNAEIAELKKKIERSEQYEQYVNAGKQIREMIDGFMEGGLSEDLAIKLVAAAAGEAAKWCIK